MVRHRLQHLGAGCDVLDHALQLGALEQPLGQVVHEAALEHAHEEALQARARERPLEHLLGPRVLEHGVDEPVDIEIRDDLRRDALGDVVLRDRARHRIGERAGERAVDRPLELGRRDQLRAQRLDQQANAFARMAPVRREHHGRAVHGSADPRQPRGDTHGSEHQAARRNGNASPGEHHAERDVTGVHGAMLNGPG